MLPGCHLLGVIGIGAFHIVLVLCLTAIMLLVEEYKSLFSCTEKDKGNCPLSNQFSIPVSASVLPPVAIALTFMEGRDLTGTRAFMIPFLYGLLHIMLYRSMRQYLAISSISSFLQVLLGAGTLCALGQEIVQDISWLTNLTG
jgi:hypothetical protein